jgi:hypothetical protein
VAPTLPPRPTQPLHRWSRAIALVHGAMRHSQHHHNASHLGDFHVALPRAKWNLEAILRNPWGLMISIFLGLFRSLFAILLFLRQCDPACSCHTLQDAAQLQENLCTAEEAIWCSESALCCLKASQRPGATCGILQGCGIGLAGLNTQRDWSAYATAR